MAVVGRYEALDALITSGRRTRAARTALGKSQTIDRLAHVWERELQTAIERASAQ